jgi:anti-anti-sigma factor
LPDIVAYEEQPPVLRCTGDEDLATQAIRRRAFACALKSGRNVVVDLSELAFADSSLMFDLAILAQRMRGDGQRLRLRQPQPQIVRLIEVVGLHRQPGVDLA